MSMRLLLDGDLFELTPELVRARLQGHAPETIRDYWVEIDGSRWPVKQVISLATGVRERRRFQSQSARRWLGNLGFPIGSGQQVIPRSARSGRPSPGADQPTSSTEPPQRDLVLVGCVKSKRDSGAAPVLAGPQGVPVASSGRAARLTRQRGVKLASRVRVGSKEQDLTRPTSD